MQSSPTGRGFTHPGGIVFFVFNLPGFLDRGSGIEISNFRNFRIFYRILTSRVPIESSRRAASIGAELGKIREVLRILSVIENLRKFETSKISTGMAQNRPG